MHESIILGTYKSVHHAGNGSGIKILFFVREPPRYAR
jgi:hypothetical protein